MIAWACLSFLIGVGVGLAIAVWLASLLIKKQEAMRRAEAEELIRAIAGLGSDDASDEHSTHDDTASASPQLFIASKNWYERNH